MLCFLTSLKFNGASAVELKVRAVWWLLRHQFFHVTSSYSSCFLCKTPYCCLWNSQGGSPWFTLFSKGCSFSRVRMGKRGSRFPSSSMVCCQRNAAAYTYLPVPLRDPNGQHCDKPSLLSQQGLFCMAPGVWQLFDRRKRWWYQPLGSSRFLALAFIIPNLSPVEVNSW